MIVVNKYITFLFSFGQAQGVMIYPFIFLKDQTYKNNFVFINHERIHKQQALEMGIVFFYILYLIEMVCRSIIKLSFEKAYRTISFEQEAYQNEKNISYLKNRKKYAFIKYYKMIIK